MRSISPALLLVSLAPGCTGGSHAVVPAATADAPPGGAAVGPPRRCASEIEPTQKLAEALAEAPEEEPRAQPPGAKGPLRERLRALQRGVRELDERVGRVATPLRLQLELESSLPAAYRLEAVEVRLDGKPIFASTEPDRPVARARLAPGTHFVHVELVLRADFKGGLYDSVGYCFRTSAGYGFKVARPTAKDAPPVMVLGVVHEASPRSVFSSRPGLRFTSSATAVPVELDFSE